MSYKDQVLLNRIWSQSDHRFGHNHQQKWVFLSIACLILCDSPLALCGNFFSLCARCVAFFLCILPFHFWSFNVRGCVNFIILFYREIHKHVFNMIRTSMNSKLFQHKFSVFFSLEYSYETDVVSELNNAYSPLLYFFL